MSIFGDLFGGDQIDSALINVLKRWMPTYLREIVRQRGLEVVLDAPRSYIAVSDFEHWPEEQLPSVVIVNPGISEGPKKDGAGTYRASWPVQICITVSAPNEPECRRNAQLYIAAARGCIMGRRSLEAGMKGTDWTSEDYELIDSDMRRSQAGARATFVIERENVVTVGAGPTDPELDPQPEDWPEVTDTEVSVEKEKL